MMYKLLKTLKRLGHKMIDGFKKTLAMLVDKDGNAISNNNPLPVAQPDGLEGSGTATSATSIVHNVNA